MRLKRKKHPSKLSFTICFQEGRVKAIEIKDNGLEAIAIDPTPSNANKILLIETRRHKVQLMPEKMKLNAEKSGQCREVHNAFNDLNHLIVEIDHAFCKKDHKLDND